ncbi:hypothetical protein GCM10010430_01910 [Kitasatospora cystarginea]|uniref:histidine kinase n=1 Tax=Kitasatospora cystarginea TaxID=58350 RepID=A0ABN3DBK9_9ACTN
MSLRTALLVLAVVPGLALAALWAVTSGQTLLDFQRQAAQGLLAQKAGQPSNIVYYNLQEERRLSAEALGAHAGATDALVKQRKQTDDAIRTFQELSSVATDGAPTEVRAALAEARRAMTQLSAERLLVDQGGEAQQAAVYRYYTQLIAVDLKLFTTLSHVDNGKVATVSQPLVDLFWSKEMISRSDALLAQAWPTGKLGAQDYQGLVQSISDQSFQFVIKVAPYLPTNEQAMAKQIIESPAWQAKTEVEKDLLRPAAADSNGSVPIGASQQQIAADQKKWRQAMDDLNPKLVDLVERSTDTVVSTGKSEIMSLLIRVVLTAVVGLVAVIAVILTTWRLTRTLRHRIGELQEQAEELGSKLPEVVERLGQGEQIDVETEARGIARDDRSGVNDELAQLGAALNLARSSALTAAVRQAEQHRGFERLLQRIARRTQLLIGQQLKRLDELERKHEDPEVLDGLFDLDHLTARLRRYEENLVILAGGTPHRRWRKPVPLLDVMRSAQGEVQDYRRVILDVDGSPWLSERAVGPVAHILAELIENALSFSRPPSPVEVRAARVSRGTVIEVEDRGLGMDEAQLAEANQLMGRPPRTDVLARADDIRLGFFVIARLAAQHGLRVEFRPSAFGGTRAVVLIPDELIAPDGPARPVAVPQPATEGLPTRKRGRALAGVTPLIEPVGPAVEPSGPLIEPVAVATEPSGPLAEPLAPMVEPLRVVADAFGPAQEPGPVDETYESHGGHGMHEAFGGHEEHEVFGGHGAFGGREEHEVFGGHGAFGGREEHGQHEVYGAQSAYEPHQEYGSYELRGPDGHPTEVYPDPEPSWHAAPQAALQDMPQAWQPPAEVRERPAGRESDIAVDTADEQPGPRDTVVPSGPSTPSAEPPLPRRIRQASLVDELRVNPAPQAAAPKPPRWDENPLLRPAPRRAGAAIGAFQRRSRAAREGAVQPGQSVPPGQQQPVLPEWEYRTGAGEPQSTDPWNTTPIPTTEDRS